jgi:hypothetical protein
MTHPELANPNARSPTLHVAVFDPAGQLREVLTRPDPLKINPTATAARAGVGPEFDAAELEAYLAREFGGFERATIRVRPFAIPEIGVELNPLLSTQAGFLDDPTDYDEEEQESIREWIEEGCGALLYGNDYFLGGDGEVTSS